MIRRRKFSDDEKKRVYRIYNGKCAICGDPVSRKEMTISHKTPLSKGGTNGISNLMLSCWTCNHMKNNMCMNEFKLAVAKVYRFGKLKNWEN